MSRAVLAVNTAPDAMRRGVELWAESTTGQDLARHDDLVHDKTRAVLALIAHAGKHPAQIGVGDVVAWQEELAGRLKPATVYAMVSRVSSFYRWLREQGEVTHNPAETARPKAPAPYQNEHAKSLDDDEVRMLCTTIKQAADAGNITAKRDYAMLRLYLATGMRRESVCGLRWGDLKINGTIRLTATEKGGGIVTREVNSKVVKAALIDYLTASGRLNTMQADSPLWIGHAYHDKGGAPLKSRSFVDNLKRWARRAGIGHFHLHMTRHTFARITADDTGSLIETQAALGHHNAQNTRIYVERLGVKRDRYSDAVDARIDNAS